MATLHKVQPGDCLTSIAARYAFTDPLVIWDDAKNAAIKRLRANPNLLFPGDIVYIPDKKQKQETRAVGQRHQFTIGVGTKTLRIALEDEAGQRIKNAPYTLKVSDRIYQGQTDGEGVLKKEIPLDAMEGELKIQGHLWPLQIGYLNPVENVPDQGVSGIKARLRNLGYDPGDPDGPMDENTEAAIRAFQQDSGLPEDGVCTPKSATFAKLTEKHGC